MAKTSTATPKSPASPSSPSSPIPQPDPSITVTRSAKAWMNGGNRSSVNVVMSIPKDVMELTGIKAGDSLLVTGYADGTIRVVKADVIPGMTR